MTDININANLPESVDNAIKNVTDLPTQGIGQTLSDCWFLAFGGISQLAEKRRIKYTKDLEKFKKELEDSLETVPEQRRKEPTTQIVLKTLDEAKYCVEEDDLRQLFVALLTSATDSGKNVHPSFAQIIGQMSSNDAKLLQCFKSSSEQPICNIRCYLNKEKTSYDVVVRNIFLSGSSEMMPNEKSISISSLQHLGLIEISWTAHFSNEDIYTPFLNSSIFFSTKKKYSMYEIALEKGIAKLSPLGVLFVSCCIPKVIK